MFSIMRQLKNAKKRRQVKLLLGKARKLVSKLSDELQESVNRELARNLKRWHPNGLPR